MKITSFAAPVLSAAMVLAGGTLHAQGYPQQQQNYPQQQQGYPQQQGQQGGWDQVPQDYSNDVQRQGFRDGIGAARFDVEQHRQPNSTYQQTYRHPPVPKRVRNDYLAGFQRGYDTAYRHMTERHDERDDRRDGDHRDGERRDDHRNDNPNNYPQQAR